MGGVLCAAVLVIRSWVVIPHLGSLKAAQKYEHATSERIKMSRSVNLELRAKQTRLEKLKEACTSLSDMAFSTAKGDEFLSDLEAFCEETGCVIAALSFMNGDDRAGDRASSVVVAKGAALTIRVTPRASSRSPRPMPNHHSSPSA